MSANEITAVRLCEDLLLYGILCRLVGCNLPLSWVFLNYNIVHMHPYASIHICHPVLPDTGKSLCKSPPIVSNEFSPLTLLISGNSRPSYFPSVIFLTFLMFPWQSVLTTRNLDSEPCQFFSLHGRKDPSNTLLSALSHKPLTVAAFFPFQTINQAQTSNQTSCCLALEMHSQLSTPSSTHKHHFDDLLLDFFFFYFWPKLHKLNAKTRSTNKPHTIPVSHFSGLAFNRCTTWSCVLQAACSSDWICASSSHQKVSCHLSI